LGAALDAEDAMDALRGAVAQLDSGASAAGVTAAIAVFAAAWWRRRGGLDPVAADPSLDHAADLLRMLRGEAAGPAEVRALSTYLVAVADHGMNASTFAARVVTSTRSDRVSAVCAAIAALKGPLHGGAPGPVLDALDAGAADIEAHVRAELDAGQRIMGMGHRVYRVRDPRAAVLERAAAELAAETGRPSRVEAARALERAARAALAERHPDRSLCANVELYTAVLLDALAIDRALFTAIFAAGRVIGWCAHIDEERRRGRLIRPRARYVGPRP
jgi:citrate synthase